MKVVTKAQWQMFVDPQKSSGLSLLNEVELPNAIKNSWLRSKKQQVDPYRVENKLLKGRALQQKIQRNEVIVQLFKSEIERFARYHTMVEPLFVLTDLDGVILYRAGHHTMLDSANQIAFREGNRWNEATVGTNAIALALMDNRSSCVLGLQHYNLTSHAWNCWATPIFDRGEPVAVIDLSSQRLPENGIGELMTFVELIGENISLKLTQYALAKDQLLFQYVAENPHVAAVLDQTGRVVKADLNLRSYGVESGSQVTVDALQVETQLYQKQALIKEGQLIGYTLQTVEPQFIYRGVATQNDQMKQTLHDANALAKSDLPVHIYGETGAGKESLACAIHENSAFAKGPLIAVNCGALSEQLLESELFGYAAGAFTDAKKSGYQGKLIQADGGTLFLDEIDSMSFRMQQLLLRVLEEKRVTPLGSETAQATNFRLVSASNRDLKTLVREGKFRKDLYYRIFVGVLELPPLRERKEDLTCLIAEFAKEKNWDPPWLSTVIPIFAEYDWEGNIRELRNVLERLLAFYPTDAPTAADIRRLIQIGSLQLKTTTTNEEKSTLLHALRKNQFRMAKTAEDLGISRSTLYRKLKQYEIEI